MMKHSGHFRTLKKCRKHSPAARVFYISLVFSNARLVLSQCNTRLRLLYLLSIARLAYLMSKHMRTSPFVFSTATRGLIQLVGPFTFSIASSASSSSNLSTTFCFLLNGILRMAWAIGVTLSSTCSFN